MDVARASEALSRPGIDPRDFVQLAIVEAVAVNSDGVYIDVRTAHGQPETATLSAPYGGNGYGLHLPIELDETVVLALPYGSFNAGARVIGRNWDPGDAPPTEAIDHPEDVVLVVRPGQSVRVIVKGGGDVIFDPRDGGKIKHGGEDADDPLVRKSDLDSVVAKLNSLIAKFTAHVHPGVTSGGASTLVTVTPETPVTPPSGSPVAVST